jgi:hypothetical protein
LTRLILVDGHLVLDVASPVGISQRIQRFHEVLVGGRDAGDHERAAVAAQRVLEQTGQLGIAIGHVAANLFAVAQRAYDVAKSEQTCHTIEFVIIISADHCFSPFDQAYARKKKKRKSNGLSLGLCFQFFEYFE